MTANVSTFSATENALNSLTKSNTEIAIKALNSVPIVKLCSVAGLPSLVRNYNLSCLMDFISQNYSLGDDLQKVAEEILDYQNKYNVTEDDAIDIILERRGYYE